jgi:tRNA-specific 2-thiouridylase
MKNWSQDLPGMVCPWKDDYQDAKRVAVQLGIPFKMYDFETEYREKVVEYMLEGYKAGITPNPDIMCNQEVKFKLFLNAALADGADMIATGHYARVEQGRLLTATNAEKDQTYFLYRVSEDALNHTLMPIGDFTTKIAVRAEAAKLGLATAEKKDSQGICFVGKVGIKDFLLFELGQQRHGAIKDENGVEVGEHDGALFYTIGQRHGLDVGGGLPYYVVGKDMGKNEVYVTRKLDDDRLWLNELTLTSAHWINGEPDIDNVQVRMRYRAPLVAVNKLEKSSDGNWQMVLNEQVRAVTPGQSAVFYRGEHCLGGAIVV